jgi:hypothetical protein
MARKFCGGSIVHIEQDGVDAAIAISDQLIHYYA